MRRAVSLLDEDIDALEEAWEKAGGAVSGRAVKVQAPGPITLAAGLELPNGHRAITDAGAVRDLTASLAEGVERHRAEVARRLATTVVVQYDEPVLPAALAGRLTGVTSLEPGASRRRGGRDHADRRLCRRGGRRGNAAQLCGRDAVECVAAQQYQRHLDRCEHPRRRRPRRAGGVPGLRSRRGARTAADQRAATQARRPTRSPRPRSRSPTESASRAPLLANGWGSARPAGWPAPPRSGHAPRWNWPRRPPRRSTGIPRPSSGVARHTVDNVLQG